MYVKNQKDYDWQNITFQLENEEFGNPNEMNIWYEGCNIEGPSCT